MSNPRRRLCFECLEKRELLAVDLLQLNHFPTWDGGVIPSTDVAGLTYHAPSGHLFLADSEINELPEYYQGHNVFEIALAGDQVFREIATGNSEPTGITYSEFDGFFYVTNDGNHTVTRYDEDFNPLLEIDTTDGPAAAGDPEDIASNPLNGDLYVVDGKSGSRQVVVYDADFNFKSKFSFADRLDDAEGIAYDPVRGNLLLAAHGDGGIFEYTLGGVFIRKYSFDGLSPNPINLQGLTFAPTSDPGDDPEALALYISDLGEDNFPDGGVYEVLLVSDGGNSPPVVYAGPDQSVNGNLPIVVFLDGLVNDDGLPDLPGAVAITWSQVSGPGAASFSDPNAVDSTVTFGVGGEYVLRLTADDGELVRTDDVTIFVNLFTVTVSAGSDDAEESRSGSINLASGDLDLGDTITGIRFDGLEVPQGATITNAYIQFTADKSNATVTNLTIQGEASDHAGTFTTTNSNISSRPQTSTSVNWAPPSWTVGEAGANQQTPNLAAVVQEIVDRPGWASGNALALIIAGTGHREARPYEDNPQFAPELIIEFNLVPNTPPTISDIDDQGIDEDMSTGAIAFTIGDAETPDALTITGNSSNTALVPDGNIVFGGSGTNRTVTVTPISDQFGSATITVTVTDAGGLLAQDTFTLTVTPVNDPPVANPQFVSTAINTPVALTLTGSDTDEDPLTYVIATQPVHGELSGGGPNLVYTPNPGFSGADSFTFKVNDGQADSAAATVDIAVASESLQVQVNGGTDDAEETGSGAMDLNSGDLDVGARPVGVRFNDVDIPQGALIASAYIQFTADKSSATTTNLVIHGENSDNAATFTNANFNITSRPTTGASVNWALAAWAADESGLAQQTPDLSAVLQEIVNRAGWTNGNSLALVITGFGDRAITSFNRDPASAPTLFVELGPGMNSPPVADSQSVATGVGAPLDITLTASDPQQDPLTFSVESQPSHGILSGSGPNITYTPDPGYIGPDSFTFKVNDGEFDSNIATVDINVAAGSNTIQAQALTSADDAEETGSGVVDLDSRDLDLGIRPVGVRFSGLNIPQGAIIANAYLQFTADKSDSTITNLTIAAHATDDAAAFTTVNGNITSRPTTVSTVNWSVPAWTSGDSGAAERSPDLTAVIQEVIDRGGWASGNALAFILAGSGARAAKSVDGEPLAAPILVIEFFT